MTTNHILPYANLVLVLFFITFFTDIFYQYFRYKTLVPRKMLSYKKGGLFEHYFIVLAITAVILILHLGFGMDPFFGDPNILSFGLSVVTMYFTALVFLVFFLIFMLYLGFYFYAKMKGIEDRNEFLSNQGHRIVKTSFISSFILATVVTILVLFML